MTKRGATKENFHMEITQTKWSFTHTTQKAASPNSEGKCDESLSDISELSDVSCTSLVSERCQTAEPEKRKKKKKKSRLFNTKDRNKKRSSKGRRSRRKKSRSSMQLDSTLMHESSTVRTEATRAEDYFRAQQVSHLSKSSMKRKHVFPHPHSKKRNTNRSKYKASPTQCSNKCTKTATQTTNTESYNVQASQHIQPFPVYPSNFSSPQFYPALSNSSTTEAPTAFGGIPQTAAKASYAGYSTGHTYETDADSSTVTASSQYEAEAEYSAPHTNYENWLPECEIFKTRPSDFFMRRDYVAERVGEDVGPTRAVGISYVSQEQDERTATVVRPPLMFASSPKGTVVRDSEACFKNAFAVYQRIGNEEKARFGIEQYVYNSKERLLKDLHLHRSREGSKPEYVHIRDLRKDVGPMLRSHSKGGAYLIIHYHLRDNGVINPDFGTKVRLSDKKYMMDKCRKSNFMLVLFRSGNSLEVEFWTEERMFGRLDAWQVSNLHVLAEEVGEKLQDLCRRAAGGFTLRLKRPQAVNYKLLTSRNRINIEGRDSTIRCEYWFDGTVKPYDMFMEQLQKDFADSKLPEPFIDGAAGICVYENIFSDKEFEWLEKRVRKFITKHSDSRKTCWDKRSLKPLHKFIGHIIGHLVKCGLVMKEFINCFDLIDHDGTPSDVTSRRDEYSRPIVMIQLFGGGDLYCKQSAGRENVCGIPIPHRSVSVTLRDSFIADAVQSTFIPHRKRKTTSLILRRKW